MKLTLVFKNPDWEEAAFSHMTADEVEVAREEIAKSGITNKFLKWEEYLTVELDTEKMTATVLEA